MINSVSPGSLLLTFLIVLVLFGTKKLRTIGADLGGAVRSFRQALNGEEPDANKSTDNKNTSE